MAGEDARPTNVSGTLTAMIDAQEIFGVFYAIFWGGVFSVLSRWKPFNFGLIFNKEVKHITKRITLALFILNVLPILYFASILWLLELKGNLCELQREKWIEFIAMVLSGIIPAFGIFGFYRIWIGIVEKFPNTFYVNSYMIPHKYKPYRGAAHEPEISLRKLGIEPSNKYTYWKNIIIGIGFVLLGASGVNLPYITLFTILLIITLIWLWPYSRPPLIAGIIPLIILCILYCSLLLFYYSWR